MKCTLIFYLSFFRDVDDYALRYLVSILETYGGNEDDVETGFDVDEFIEMMAAYIPGFGDIEKYLICR